MPKARAQVRVQTEFRADRGRRDRLEGAQNLLRVLVGVISGVSEVIGTWVTGGDRRPVDGESL